MRRNTILLTLATLVVFIACKKNDNVKYAAISDYVKPAKGKYIIYKLDSIITRSFGASFTVSSYTIKDSVVDVFTDNTGRQAFKIFRYHLNPAGNTWSPVNTFVLSPQANSLEYVENNFRYISLVDPITDGKAWKGNSYIVQSPFYANASFSDWNYTYTDVGQPKKVGTFNFNNTVTVVQYDSNENKPFFPNNFNSYDRGYEIYAESVGLVYRDIMSWEYQVFTSYNNCKLVKPKNPGPGFDTIPINCNLASTNCDSLKNVPNHKIIGCDTVRNQYYYNGYGIKQTILGHN